MAEGINSIAGHSVTDIYAGHKEAVAKLGTTDLAATLTHPGNPDFSVTWSTRAKMKTDIAKLSSDEAALDEKYDEPRKDLNEVMFVVTDGVNVTGSRVTLATAAPDK